MQDIFAADNGNALLVTDERGRAFLLDLSTREARPVLILPWQGEEVFPRKVDSSDVSLPLFSESRTRVPSDHLPVAVRSACFMSGVAACSRPHGRWDIQWPEQASVASAVIVA